MFLKFFIFIVGSFLLSQVEEIGDSLFSIFENGQTVNIPYFSNGSINENNEVFERVVVVIHGQNRNANDYFNFIQEASYLADQSDETLVFAPQFLITDDVNFWNLDSSIVFWSGTTQWTGGDLSNSTNEHPRPFSISSFTIMDSILTRFLSVFNNIDEIILIGNSAGGQFVNRYLGGTNLDGEGKIRYIVAAPSHYLYFDENRSINNFQTPIIWGEPSNCNGYNNYRYGLENLNEYMLQSSLDSIRSKYFRKKVFYLIGSLDNGGTNYCESNVQGENRLNRSIVYFQHLLNVFNYNVMEKHKIGFVSGVSHNAEELFSSSCGLYSIFSIGVCEQLSDVVFPQASFTADNNSGPYPLEVSFVNETITGTHPIVNNVWNFGNTTYLNSNNSIVTNIYNQPGVYNVSLVSYDLIGLSDSLLQSSIVQVDTLFGDLNWDSSINQNDATLILKHVSMIDTLTDLQKKTGDVDKTEDISPYDAYLILKYLNEDINVLPYEEGGVNSGGTIYSENQNVSPDNIITVPIYSDEMFNVFSFVFKISFDSQFLSFGSSYSDELNNVACILEENSFEESVFIAGAWPDTINGSFLFIDLYFLPNQNFNEETIISFDEIIFNQSDTLAGFDIVLSPNLKTKNKQKKTSFSISQNYPNPFNPSTTIQYSLNEHEFVSIYVSDITGRLIKNLFFGNQKRGIHKLIWDARNSSGQEVSSGLYYYTIKTQKNTTTKEMLLVR